MIEMVPGLPTAMEQCDLMTFAGSYMQREGRVGFPSEIIKMWNKNIGRVKEVKTRSKNPCCCISEVFHLGLSYLCSNFSECFPSAGQREFFMNS